MAKAIDKVEYFKQIGYTPHSAGQWAFHRSKARFRIPVCGRRYGKSTMAATDAEPKLFLPNTRGWIIGPTYDLGEKEFRVMWNHLIIGQKLGRDKRVKKAYSKRTGEMFIEMPWQSRVEVRSADRPESLVGEALNWVIMSEAAKHKQETFERFIQPALSDFRGEATFPTTPEGFNWLHSLWRWGLDPDFPEFESWRLPSWENPVVFPGGRNDPEIKLQEKTTDPVWFMQEYGADFAAFVGKIFVEWDEQVHVQRVEYDPRLDNYMAFDWGYTNPLAAIEFQIDSWDRVRVWREHYLSKTTLEQHLRILKGRDQPKGYRGVQLAFGDAADPEACAFVSQHYAPCVGDPAAKSNWRQGVDLVNRLLRLQEVGEGDEYGTPLEQPWLSVDHSCHNLIREFNNYRAKEPIRGQNVPEMGQKMDDHAVDALRYGLMHCFELGARSHLYEIYQPNSFNETPETGYFTTGGLNF